MKKKVNTNQVIKIKKIIKQNNSFNKYKLINLKHKFKKIIKFKTLKFENKLIEKISLTKIKFIQQKLNKNAFKRFLIKRLINKYNYLSKKRYKRLIKLLFKSLKFKNLVLKKYKIKPLFNKKLLKYYNLFNFLLNKTDKNIYYSYRYKRNKYKNKKPMQFKKYFKLIKIFDDIKPWTQNKIYESQMPHLRKKFPWIWPNKIKNKLFKRQNKGLKSAYFLKENITLKNKLRNNTLNILKLIKKFNFNKKLKINKNYLNKNKIRFYFNQFNNYKSIFNILKKSILLKNKIFNKFYIIYNNRNVKNIKMLIFGLSKNLKVNPNQFKFPEIHKIKKILFKRFNFRYTLKYKNKKNIEFKVPQKEILEFENFHINVKNVNISLEDLNEIKRNLFKFSMNNRKKYWYKKWYQYKTERKTKQILNMFSYFNKKQQRLQKRDLFKIKFKFITQIIPLLYGKQFLKINLKISKFKNSNSTTNYLWYFERQLTNLLVKAKYSPQPKCSTHLVRYGQVIVENNIKHNPFYLTKILDIIRILNIKAYTRYLILFLYFRQYLKQEIKETPFIEKNIRILALCPIRLPIIKDYTNKHSFIHFQQRNMFSYFPIISKLF